MDYNGPTEEKTESLMFIFRGGMLTQAEIESIQLHYDELSEFHFFMPETLPKEMVSILRKRVLLAWQQANREDGVYLENQELTDPSAGCTH